MNSTVAEDGSQRVGGLPAGIQLIGELSGKTNGLIYPKGDIYFPLIEFTIEEVEHVDKLLSELGITAQFKHSGTFHMPVMVLPPEEAKKLPEELHTLPTMRMDEGLGGLIRDENFLIPVNNKNAGAVEAKLRAASAVRREEQRFSDVSANMDVPMGIELAHPYGMQHLIADFCKHANGAKFKSNDRESLLSVIMQTIALGPAMNGAVNAERIEVAPEITPNLLDPATLTPLVKRAECHSVDHLGAAQFLRALQNTGSHFATPPVAGFLQKYQLPTSAARTYSEYEHVPDAALAWKALATASVADETTGGRFLGLGKKTTRTMTIDLPDTLDFGKGQDVANMILRTVAFYDPDAQTDFKPEYGTRRVIAQTSTESRVLPNLVNKAKQVAEGYDMPLCGKEDIAVVMERIRTHNPTRTFADGMEPGGTGKDSSPIIF